ncbi:MAG: class I tRNA ligase family protein [Patescibacteria group bacterium]|nr:class I tRNA ligase family protein [Patescibacteria group bacterium]
MINFDFEEKIIKFWNSHQIFEKSLEKNKNNKNFVFVEGPPYANDRPHMGHFLTRIYKDAILRFKTMIGYYVERIAGWDTHGLPIEVATEKTLCLSGKKEILSYGIEKFNRMCKELVMKFKNEWEKLDERIGFWINHQKAYVTYETYYLESCWWLIKKIYEQGFLKEEFKVFPYCPRCETVLSQAEVGQIDSYKKIKDPNVYVKFPLANYENEYFLVWTTTPWTLISNLALAINPEFKYSLYEIGNEKFWAVENLQDDLKKIYPGEIKLVKTIEGHKLLNLEYLPLFSLTRLENFENCYRVYPAEFVNREEGTGIVHIAPAFGEEDFELAKRFNLPLFNPIDNNGKFNSDEPEPIIDQINGLFFKEANPLIIEYLRKENKIFYSHLEGYEHDYPHCWRCKQPLIYYSTKNWVIKVSKFNNKLIEINKKINWIPPEIGRGRFYEWLKEGKDWNLSRTRFWGIPLPIWKCDQCSSIEIISSLQDLASKFKSKNHYYFLRHGEAVSNIKKIVSSYPEIFFNSLTPRGINQIKKILKKIKKLKIDLIITSPLLRTKQTAEIIAQELNLPIYLDFNLREIDLGEFNGKSEKEYQQFIKDQFNQYFVKPKNGENLNEVRKRMIKVILDLEEKYEGRNILIISHYDPLWSLMGEMQGLSISQTVDREDFQFNLGEIKKVDFLVLPRDEEGEINLHRPYVDKFYWKCRCGGLKKRVEEIVDIWFDSGAAPFASRHYPFENKKEIDENFLYPIDFISEGVDQTRGWFYTLLVIGYLIKKDIPYKNVISLGLVLDKEGKKMSKSLGNVIDPMEAIKKWGSDLLRFYFYYLNEALDNKRFDENSLIALQNNYFNIVLNILNFYYMYYTSEKNKIKKIQNYHLIDRWFDIRFKLASKKIFDSLNDYNPNKASRELYNLVDDFSHWWLRRSRKRFQKPKNKNEKLEALIKLEDYLFNFAIFSAPLHPIFSEYLYQELKNEVSKRKKVQVSVHLERIVSPPLISKKEEEILKMMEKVRKIISSLVMLRKINNFKIRQPLSDAYLAEKIPNNFLEIIKEETNIKNIYLGEPKNKNNYLSTNNPINIYLNKTITPQLKEEGIVNDFLRYFQDLRQDLKLIPSQKINVSLELNNNLRKIIFKNINRIKKEVNINKLNFGKIKKFKLEREFNYDNFGKVTIFVE